MTNFVVLVTPYKHEKINRYIFDNKQLIWGPTADFIKPSLMGATILDLGNHPIFIPLYSTLES